MYVYSATTENAVHVLELKIHVYSPANKTVSNVIYWVLVYHVIMDTFSITNNVHNVTTKYVQLVHLYQIIA